MRRMLPLALLLAPTALAAQLPGASIRGLGLGGTYTVNARGFEAAGWNPAVLAGRHNTSFSIGLPQAQLEFGSNTYNLKDFLKYQGTKLSPQDKQDLLARIDTTLAIRTIVGIAPVGLQIWRLAFSIGTAGGMDAGLGKDAVDLALFGNASRATPFTAAGTRGGGWAATTAAFSFAWPFELPVGRLSIGGTYKKVWGHGMARGTELSSSFVTNPQFNAALTGQTVYTGYPSNFDVKGVGDLLGGEGSPGKGSGVDVGALLEMGHLTLGAALVNLAGSMTWDASRMTYERAAYTVSQNATGGVTNALVHTTLIGAAIDGDPAAKAFKDSVMANANFSRVLRAGASWRMGGLLVGVDGSMRLKDGLDYAPKTAVSAGAEYVLLGVLPLRGGIGIGDGLTFSAGTGLYLGPLHLDLGIADITGTTRPGVRVGAGLSLMFGGGYHAPRPAEGVR